MAEKTVLTQRGQRAILFAVFLACGLLVFTVFSHYFPFFSGSTDVIGRVVVALIFLSAALLSRRSKRFAKYEPVWFAFFVACVAISVDYYLGLSKWLLPALRLRQRRRRLGHR